jgi:aminoglycoside phosphotransferase (APT) family kinase protein
MQLDRRVTSCVPLVGGLSSAVHLVDLAGTTERVVLRRYTMTEWMEREPNIPHDEARALGLLPTLDLGVPTPRLLAADPDGVHCDVPAVVMTEVPGRPLIDPDDRKDWAEQLAACLVGIHAVDLPKGIPRYRRWDRPSSPVPTWVTDPGQWLAARNRISGPLPDHETVFLHRDYHPNNVHWQDGQICAVVDWLSACLGPVAADLAHCRWNLAVLADPETAERFTARYRELTGYSENTTEYDLSTILSGPVGPFPTGAWNALGREDLTSDTVAPRIEAWLGHVLG